MDIDREMLIEERDSLRRQLRRYRRVLLELQEQRANYGLNPPIDLINGIAKTEENIEGIETRLAKVTEDLSFLDSVPSKPAAEL